MKVLFESVSTHLKKKQVIKNPRMIQKFLNFKFLFLSIRSYTKGLSRKIMEPFAKFWESIKMEKFSYSPLGLKKRNNKNKTMDYLEGNKNKWKLSKREKILESLMLKKFCKLAVIVDIPTKMKIKVWKRVIRLRLKILWLILIHKTMLDFQRIREIQKIHKISNSTERQ